MKSLYLKTLQWSVSLLCVVLILSSSAVALAAGSNAGTATTLQSQAVSQSAASSPNWSGYAATGTTFSRVASQFTVPTVSCTTAGAESLFWVGLDGYQSTTIQNSTVEQIGVAATCGKVNSTPQYFAWWQMFAKGSTEPFNQITGFTIKPGSVVTEEVTYNPIKKNYVLQLVDSAQSFSTTRLCASGYDCTRQSAEWIAERYTLNFVNGKATYTPLATWSGNALFNKDVAASDANTTLKAINQFNHAQIYMYDGGPMATPSSLEDSGTEFGVGWIAAN